MSFNLNQPTKRQHFPFITESISFDDLLKQTYAHLPPQKRQLLLDIREGRFPADPIADKITFEDLNEPDPQGQEFNLIFACSMLMRWHQTHGNPALATQYQAFLKKCFESVINTEDRPDLLHWAAATGQANTVARLLSEHPDWIGHIDRFGRTAFHIACLHGHLDVVQALLEKHALPNQPRVINDDTRAANDYKSQAVMPLPLHAAWQARHLDIVEYLVKRDDIDLNLQDGDYGRTILAYACLRGESHLVQLLLQRKANVHSKNYDDETPLYAACMSGWDASTDIVKQLVGAGAVVNIHCKYGQTPLLRACINGTLELVKYLCDNMTLEFIDKANNHGRTALHFAVGATGALFVEELLKRGANPKTVDLEGETPLSLACDIGRADVVAILLNFGDRKNYDADTLQKARASALAGQERESHYPASAPRSHYSGVFILIEEAERRLQLPAEPVVLPVKAAHPVVAQPTAPPARRIRDDMEAVIIDYEPVQPVQPIPNPVVKQTTQIPDPKVQDDLKAALKKAVFAGDAKMVSQLLARATHRPDNLEGLLYAMSAQGKVAIVDALLSQNKFPFTQAEKDFALTRTCHATTFMQPEELGDQLQKTVEVLLRHDAGNTKEVVTKLLKDSIGSVEVRACLQQHSDKKFPSEKKVVVKDQQANAGPARNPVVVKGMRNDRVVNVIANEKNDYAEGEKFLAYVSRWRDKKFSGLMLSRGALKAKLISQILNALRDPAMKAEMGPEKYTEVGLLNQPLNLKDTRKFQLSPEELNLLDGIENISLRQALNFHRATMNAERALDTKSWGLFQRITAVGLRSSVSTFLSNTEVRISKERRSPDNTRKGNALEKLRLSLEYKDYTLENICRLSVSVDGKAMNLLQVLMIHRDPKKKDSTKPTKAFKEFAKQFHLTDRFSPEEIKAILDEKPESPAQPGPK